LGDNPCPGNLKRNASCDQKVGFTIFYKSCSIIFQKIILLPESEKGVALLMFESEFLIPGPGYRETVIKFKNRNF
jgi:hypothetical protein